MDYIERVFATPAIGFPEVDAGKTFKAHPELLEWYTGNVARPLEDIASMHMSKQSNEITHIWVLFRSDSSIVAYRQFRQEHDVYVPL